MLLGPTHEVEVAGVVEIEGARRKADADHGNVSLLSMIDVATGMHRGDWANTLRFLLRQH